MKTVCHLLLQNLLWLSLLLFSALTAGSQKSYRISTNDGLSTNNLTVVIKDRNNFMWLGSFDGVQKHEGARVTVYKSGGADSLSLRGNEVHPVFDDRQGFIWAGTVAGLDRIDPRTAHIRHYPLKSKYAFIEDNGYIYSIFQDKQDSIWVISDGGFYRINAQTGGYTQIQSGSTNGEGVFEVSGGYKATVVTTDGIWLYTNSGLVFYDYATHTFFNRYHNPQHKQVFALDSGPKMGANGELCTDGKGHLYFIAQNNVLIKYDTATDTWNAFPFTPPPGAWKCCNAMACDFKGNIWIGFRQGGILLFDQRTNAFTPIRAEGVNSLIGSNYIYSFAEDYEHRMWVTTNNGVYVVDLYSSGISEVYLSDQKDFTNLQYFSEQLTEDSAGNLYMPFRKGGLLVYNQHTSAVTHYAAGENVASYGLIFPRRKGENWMAEGNTLYPISFAKTAPQIDRRKALVPVGAGPAAKIVVALQLKDGVVLKQSNGLIVVQQPGRAVKKIKGFEAFRLLSAAADCSAFYYLNPQLNLVHYDMATQLQDTFLITPVLQQQAFSYTGARDLLDDGRGRVWIATQNGLIRYDVAQRTIRVFTIQDGLSNAFAFGLCADKSGGVWALTLGGISRYDAAANRFRTVYNFNSTTFLDAAGSARQLQNGTLAFHAGNRLVLVDPDSVATVSTSDKQLQLSRFEVAGQPMGFSKSSLSLSHTQNQLMLQFGLLDFENAARVSYFYNLNGNAGDWVALGNQSTLFFYALQPGAYALRIKAIDGLGRPVPNELQLSFRIHPPFYRSGLFYILLLALVLAGALWAYMSFRKRYKTQQRLGVFMASLSRQTNVEELAVDLASNSMRLLGFCGCAVYLEDEDAGVLALKAMRAIPAEKEEVPPTIRIGAGQWGKALQQHAATCLKPGKPGRGHLKNKAALLVPITAGGHVYGALYAWYFPKRFGIRQYLFILSEVAAASAVRLSKYFTEDRLRSRIAQDLHDDLGSTLSSININSKMALESAAPQDVKSYLQKIKYNSGSMMESMSDIVWAIDPQNDTLQKVILRMKEFAAEILEPLNIDYHFTETLGTTGLGLNLAQRKNLYLVFKESVNNAAKYSGCTQVAVLLQNNNGIITLQVTDNGKGFDAAAVKRGNGLRNMAERAVDMNAEIKVHSTTGNGTTITLKMPIT